MIAKYAGQAGHVRQTFAGVWQRAQTLPIFPIKFSNIPAISIFPTIPAIHIFPTRRWNYRKIRSAGIIENIVSAGIIGNIEISQILDIAVASESVRFFRSLHLVESKFFSCYSIIEQDFLQADVACFFLQMISLV